VRIGREISAENFLFQICYWLSAKDLQHISRFAANLFGGSGYKPLRKLGSFLFQPFASCAGKILTMIQIKV
jgi:hypothetical protein